MDDILNFYQSTARIGTAGQPKADQFAHIQAAGYSVVLNLAMADASNAVAAEEKIVTSLGMAYIHIPVPFDQPNVQHVRAFFGVMDGFANDKVFVHCALNLRVSAFMQRYLVLRHGFSIEEASSPFLKQWAPKIDAKWQAIIDLTASDLGL